MRKIKHTKFTLARETIVNLALVRGGDSAEPTGSILHNLCNSVGCPKPK
jgi:hypothetical protein